MHSRELRRLGILFVRLWRSVTDGEGRINAGRKEGRGRMEGGQIQIEQGGKGEHKVMVEFVGQRGGDEDREGGGVFFWKREGGHGKKWGRGKEGPSLADILNLKIVQ